MPEPTVIPAGGGEVIGDSPDRRVELLSDDDALHATWSRFGPGRAGADLHVHHRHTDLFYVLEGELTIRLGLEDERVIVPAGTLVRVPPLVVHGFLNGADEEVRYLNLHAPGRGFADFMRALRDGRELAYDQVPPPADGGRPRSEAAIGATEALVDRPGLRATLLADVDEIAIARVEGDPAQVGALGDDDSALESLYVLEGELAIETGGRELRAAAGSWAQLPAGVEGTVTVSGTGPARYLIIRTPGAGLRAPGRWPTDD